MAEYKLVAEEIAQIDMLLNDRYEIISVTEDLEGAYVTFRQPSTKEERMLHIKMANTRKYFSSKIAEQMTG